MYDEELLELDADIGNLTEAAQQVLRDEIKRRGLHRARAADEAPKLSERVAAPQWDRNGNSADEDNTEESDLPREYTWKTLLCECSEQEEAWQIRTVLKEAGIESWIEGPRSQYSRDMRNPRVLVAADQLEQAREIAARPIPQAIVEQSKMPFEDFEPLACPKCGAEDPVLESVDPVNTWLCEECGNQWTDSVEDPNESSAH
jgi:hypothetical protein